MSSYAATEALIQASSSDNTSLPTTAQAILLFDNEEVGSVSHHGAESNMLPNLIARLTSAGIVRVYPVTSEGSQRLMSSTRDLM